MTPPCLHGAFPNGGTLVPAPGAQPVLLVGGGAWLVRSGRIDVFTTELAGMEPVGPRRHLFRAEAGQPLFGVQPRAPDGPGLLAVGATGTELTAWEACDVRHLAHDPRTHAQFAGLLHAWIECLYAAMAAPAPEPRPFRSIEAGEELSPEPGTRLRAAGRVVWVAPRAGAVRPCGRPAHEARQGELIPAAASGWLECCEGARLRVISTERLLAGGDGGPEALWAGLDRVHGALLEACADRQEWAREAERDRLRRRAEVSQSVMRTALTGLAAPMEPGGPGTEAEDLPPGRADEALHAALRAVLRAGGIDTGSPGQANPRELARDPVGALARAFRVRTRQVVLREGWWRSDAGPLLGSTAEGDRPVALLPLDGGGYRWYDPRERSSRRVTAKAATELAPFAQTFYRPLAAHPLRGVEVLRFGLHGSRGDVQALVGAAAGVALLGVVTPIATRALFDQVIPGAERGQLLQLTLILLVCALAGAGFHVVRGIALLRIESRTSAGLQAAVWDRLLNLPLSFFRDYSSGDLAVRAMGFEEIRRTLSGAVVSAILGAAFSVSSFALLFYYDSGLALRSTAMIALAVAISLSISYRQLRHQREILAVRAKSSGLVFQLLNGIGKLKTAGAEVHAFGLWARLFGEQREHQFRARAERTWLAVFNTSFPVLCSMALFYLVAERASAAPGSFTTGTFVAFIFAFNLCLSAALGAGSAVMGALSVVPVYEQVRPILQAAPESHAGKSDPGELTGALALHNVTFRYGEDGPLALRDVSLQVEPGEFVAFVGPSGAGKSTILRLLLGFEAPGSGLVSYDGQDLAGLDAHALRRQLGVVLQDGEVMTGDLYTNIVGSSRAPLEDAWEAARLAGLDEDIRRMPMGMFTIVSEGGSTFSGGQRQRLMIARALVNRPRLLLLDEATSALDNQTQATVAASLGRLRVTRIVAAHRLSTVMSADRIYVIETGAVVESGTYAELLARGGVFAAMAARQLA